MDRYRIPDDLMLQVVRDEAVILDPASGRYYTLNEVGTRMIQLYREHGSLEAVIAGIVAEYAVEPADARADLEQLLSDMAANGLAKPVDPQA